MNFKFSRFALFVAVLLLSGCVSMGPTKKPGGGPGGGGGGNNGPEGCAKCNPPAAGTVASGSRKPGPGPGVAHAKDALIGDKGPANGGLQGGTPPGTPLVPPQVLGPDGQPLPVNPGDTSPLPDGTAGGSPSASDAKGAGTSLLQKSDPLQSCDVETSPLRKWANAATVDSATKLFDGDLKKAEPALALEQELTKLKADAAAQLTVSTAEGAEATKRELELVTSRAKAQIMRCLVKAGAGKEETTKTLKALLELGWDPNYQDATGATLLRRAIEAGDEKLVAEILTPPAGTSKRVPVVINNSTAAEKPSDFSKAVTLLPQQIGTPPMDENQAKAQRVKIIKLLAERQFAEAADKKVFSALVSVNDLTFFQLQFSAKEPKAEEKAAYQALVEALPVSQRPDPKTSPVQKFRDVIIGTKVVSTVKPVLATPPAEYQSPEAKAGTAK